MRATGQAVVSQLSEGVGVIRLNQPERHNTLSDPLLHELAAALDTFEDDGAVDVVLLTSAGKSFCAGGNVKEFHAAGGEGNGHAVPPQADIDRQIEDQRRTVGRIHGYAKPTIAFVDGAAAGAGLGFALAADIRIGTPRTVMRTAFTAIGLSGDYGVAWLLNNLLGRSRSAELLWWNERLDADECLRLGLLNRIVDSEAPEDEALALAKELAGENALWAASVKRNLLEAAACGLDEAMPGEVLRHKLTGVSPHHRRALAEFMERSRARRG